MGALPKKMKRTCKWKPEWSRYNLTPSKRETGYVNCMSAWLNFQLLSAKLNNSKVCYDNCKLLTTDFLNLLKQLPAEA